MKTRLSFAALFLLIFQACTTSYITSTWKDKDYIPVEYKKIMVIGIIRDADRNIRSAMEAHIAGDLRDRGFAAFSSYDEYGPKALQGFTEQQLVDKLALDGFDAIVTVVLLDKERERYYVPRYVYYSPYVTYHNHFWGYYRSIYNRIEMQGYYQVRANYFWESNFYDLNTKKLVYSVQTQSFDPSSTESMAHEYGQKIVASMISHNVLRKPSVVPVKPV